MCPGLPQSRWSGKSETICAPCCGEQREVGIDCPAACPYLVAAHRYEAERPRPAGELPFPEVEISRDFLEDHQPLVVGLSLTLLRLARESAALRDGDALAALEALAKTYKTLDSGLYYEHVPDGPTAQGVAAALKSHLEQTARELPERAGTNVRPGDVLRALVFLRRLGAVHGNGRPISRRFLAFLAAQLPAEAATAKPADAPRIIIPGQ